MSIGASVFKRSRGGKPDARYSIEIRMPDGTKRYHAGYTDKQATKQLAAQLVRKLGVIRVVSVRRERLSTICDQTSADARIYGRAECRAEGFPDWSPAEFLGMFCKHNGCRGSDVVTRIEFSHVGTECPR